MLRNSALFSAASIIALAISVSAHADPAACMKVAAAKFSQWAQKQVMVDESRTFGDGSTKQDYLIFTQNTVYGRHNNSWSSLPVTRGQRSAGSPELAAKAMGLAECNELGTSNEGGRIVTAYAYTYTPDAYGNGATGKIWIANDTGLPVRQEMQMTGKPANAAVAQLVSTRYTYNEAVLVPVAAQRADVERRLIAYKWLTNLQTNRPAAAE